jgi:hypothetical protein
MPRLCSWPTTRAPSSTPQYCSLRSY